MGFSDYSKCFSFTLHGTYASPGSILSLTTKTLENGRIRYYGDIKAARTPGEMAGRRTVREWNPANGRKRTWHETVDHSGRVRQVRPQKGQVKNAPQENSQGVGNLK